MSFSESEIKAVWEKGSIALNNDPLLWRKDQCGAWIKRSDYGNTSSEYGWEIDHIKPQSKGGTNSLSNLRPLQWQNNRDKTDGRLKCPVTANGIHNTKI